MKLPGLIGKKVGMTSVFSVEGKSIPCTVIECGPCGECFEDKSVFAVCRKYSRYCIFMLTDSPVVL